MSLVIAFLLKHWQKILVLALVCYGVWMFTSMSGKIDTLSSENTRLVFECETYKAIDKAWAHVSAEQNAEIFKLLQKERDYKARLKALESRPPEVIVKYRDRIVEVPSEITADTCEVAVDQMIDLLRGAHQ